MVSVLQLVGLTVAASTIVACTSIDTPTSSDEPSQNTTWEFSWDGLEARIIELTDEAMVSGSPAQLYQLKSKLDSQSTTGDAEATTRNYWYAILNLNLIQVENTLDESRQASRLIDEAIEMLNDADYDAIEIHALLAILYRAKINHDEANTFELVMEMEDNLDAAIELDPMNRRVLLAQLLIGSDPAPGFNSVENLAPIIEDALASGLIHEQGNAFTPTWGMPLIYGFSVGLLMEQGEMDRAAQITKDAIEQYPNDSYLQSYDRLFFPPEDETE